MQLLLPTWRRARLAHCTLQRWEACPGSRCEIEETVASRFAIRVSSSPGCAGLPLHVPGSRTGCGGTTCGTAPLCSRPVLLCSRPVLRHSPAPISHSLLAPPAPLQHALMRYMAEHRTERMLQLFAMTSCPLPPAGTPGIDGRPAIHALVLPIAVRCTVPACGRLVACRCGRLPLPWAPPLCLPRACGQLPAVTALLT